MQILIHSIHVFNFTCMHLYRNHRFILKVFTIRDFHIIPLQTLAITGIPLQRFFFKEYYSKDVWINIISFLLVSLVLIHFAPFVSCERIFLPPGRNRLRTGWCEPTSPTLIMSRPDIV